MFYLPGALCQTLALTAPFDAACSRDDAVIPFHEQIDQKIGGP